MAARMETRTNKETGEVEYLDRGIDLSVGEPSDLFKGDAVIKVSTLKALVADADSYSAFVEAIESL